MKNELARPMTEILSLMNADEIATMLRIGEDKMRNCTDRKFDEAEIDEQIERIETRCGLTLKEARRVYKAFQSAAYWINALAVRRANTAGASIGEWGDDYEAAKAALTEALPTIMAVISDQDCDECAAMRKAAEIIFEAKTAETTETAKAREIADACKKDISGTSWPQYGAIDYNIREGVEHFWEPGYDYGAPDFWTNYEGMDADFVLAVRRYDFLMKQEDAE